MKIRPSDNPTTEVISMSVETVMSVAYILISLRGELLGPRTVDIDSPIKRTDTGVQMTMTDVISSTKTPTFGFTTATWVMTSGWSIKELMS
jgi:hypothetical protein